MEPSLHNQTAIVTGASRGIGSEIARMLGRRGANVVVNYLNQPRPAEDVCRAVEDSGGRALMVRADMRNIGEIENLFRQAVESFGALNILINNAGVSLFKRIEDITEPEFDEIFTCNVKGVFFACRQAARAMADHGRIINIGSSVTRVMLPIYGAYAATKGAVEQITKVLAKELGPRHITVNTVSPGPVDTELFRRGKTDAQIQALAETAALGRIGTPPDIADAVLLLLSRQAGWITGQNLLVNGGFTA